MTKNTTKKTVAKKANTTSTTKKPVKATKCPCCSKTTKKAAAKKTVAKKPVAKHAAKPSVKVIKPVQTVKKTTKSK